MSTYNFDGHKLMYHPGRVSQYLADGDCYPLYMEISPVGACNHRCIFCAYDFIGYPNRKLETSRTLKLLDELAECGLKSILFAGEGEPLLHPDLAIMIRHARNNGIDVGMFTNGQLLSSDKANEIIPALTFIRFSFNGGTSENYSRIHQVKPECFAAAITAIRTAAEIKSKQNLATSIGAQFVLIPENIFSLSAAAAILKEAGVDYLAIKPFVQQSSQQCYQLKQPYDPVQLQAVLSVAGEFSDENFNVIARVNAFNEYGKRNYEHCYGTSLITVINSAGDVASCLPYWDNPSFVYGNIAKHSFSEIWNGEKRKSVKKKPGK